MSENDMKDCTLLTEEVNNFKIANGAFGGFSEEIRIPYGVRRIAPLALAPLKRIKRLLLPQTIEHFVPSDIREPYDTSTKSRGNIWGMIVTHPASLKEIHICGENSRYQSQNGILYSADGTRLIYLPPVHYQEVVEIAEGVETLGEESCCFVEAKEIVFPKTLRRISDRACCSSNLKNSLIPSCELGESAFQGSVLSEYTDIYNGIIPTKAFANCSGVKGIRLYDSVKLVKNEAFSYTEIEKIYIPSVTRIEENAFVREEKRWIGSQVIRQHEDGWRVMKENYEYYMENYKGMIIGGALGSPAEEFANTNGIKFEVVGNSDEEIKAWLGWKDREEDIRGDGALCF